MPLRLADQLSVARQRRFIGRSDEIALFESALTADALPFHLLYLYGPGGLGKTSLLLEFALRCEKHCAKAIYLDAVNIEPAPSFFITALQKELGLNPANDPVDTFFQLHKPLVILIDNYEKLTKIDSWLRDTYLPQLPANILIVLSGRIPPSLAWFGDSGWQSILRVLPLRNFSIEESRFYLTQRNLPQKQLQNILDFAHGHPLALSMVADLIDQRPNVNFQPEDAPDLIKMLLERFVQEVPDTTHRHALEACSLVHLTTESLLAEMLRLPDAHDLFEWLRKLSFIESGRKGLRPHDLTREALAADLRWRNPDWYSELRKRAREYYAKRLTQSRGEEQRAVVFEYVYLYHGNRAIRSCFEWQEECPIHTDSMRDGDLSAIVEMVRRYESEESASLAAYWLTCQPQSALVFRDDRDQPAGFLIMLSLGEIEPEVMKVDEAAYRAYMYIQQQAPLRHGEKAVLYRYWLDRDCYQSVSPTQSRIFINAIQHYLSTSGLAYSLVFCGDTDIWHQVFLHFDLRRISGIDFQIGGKRYGVYGHDWRVVPPFAWLERLAERELSMTADSVPPSDIEPLVVLNEYEFAEATRNAMKAFANPKALNGNPLLHSRLVMNNVQDKDDISEGMETLKSLLHEAIESLKASPREAKFYRVLHRTYVNPAKSQEMASEVLNLPFSTYRRHLKTGINRVIEFLWQKEVNGNGM
jgi:hypothetical protein